MSNKFNGFIDADGLVTIGSSGKVGIEFSGGNGYKKGEIVRLFAAGVEVFSAGLLNGVITVSLPQTLASANITALTTGSIAAASGSVTMAGHLTYTDGTFNIGATGSTSSGTGFRPGKIFIKDALIAGNVLGVIGPYGLNNPLITGMVGSGNSTNTAFIAGANNTLINSAHMGFMGFIKDGAAANTVGFFNADIAAASAGGKDMYFGIGHRTSATDNLLKFGGDGTFTFMNSSGADLLWDTEGAGNIGALDEAGLPVISSIQCLADVSNSLRGTFFVINDGSSNYYVWYRTNGVGSDPGAGSISVMVDIATNATADAVAAATKTALEGVGFTVSIATATLTVTTSALADSGAASDGDTGFNITLIQDGVYPFTGIKRPDSIFAKKYIRIGDSPVFDYGPYECALEIGNPSVGSTVFFIAHNSNNIQMGAYNPGANQNTWLEWSDNKIGMIGFRNSSANYTPAWLWMDGSVDGGDKQTIRFADIGRIEWDNDGGTGDEGRIGKFLRSGSGDGGYNRPSEVHVKNFFSVGGRYNEVRTAYLRTVNSTPATLQSVTVTSGGQDSCYVVRTKIAARLLGGIGSVAGYELRALIKETAGGGLSVVNVTPLWSHEENASMDATIDVSGNAIRVQVTGLGSSVDWACTTEITQV
jgi:hypothetical protein